MVMRRPEMLIGVKWSSKTIFAALIVTTSLKIPQMLSVTTLVRLSKANSDDVMRNARVPGKTSNEIPKALPLAAIRLERPSLSSENPSTGIAMARRLTNMIGARKNIEENGFDVAGLRRSRIWVNDQRKPEDKADDITRMKPRALKAVSPATIITTPMVIVTMMKTSFHDGCSKRKRNANNKTNPRAEDLHIAIQNRVSTRERAERRLTY